MELEDVVYQVRLALLVASGLMRCHDLLVQRSNPLAGAPHTRRVQQQPGTLVRDHREQQCLYEHDEVVQVFTRRSIGGQHAQLVGDDALEHVQTGQRHV